MTSVPLKCWRCKKRQGCPMIEEISQDRELCRSMRHGETGYWCRDDLCEACQHAAFVCGICSGYDPMTLDRGDLTR